MKILVPVDGSQFSMAALDVALDYAKSKRKHLPDQRHAVHRGGRPRDLAHEREKVIQSMEKRAEYVVQQACGILAGKDVIATCRHIVASSSIPDAIIDLRK